VDPAFQWNREEYLYNRTRLTEVGVAQTPMTIRTDNGLHIAFHEASLVDYSGMQLQNEGNGRFRAVLTPSSSGAKVSRAAPFPTPWRTMQIADRAGGLVENDLVLNLNEPNRLGDVSWVEPFKYVGVWWAMHLEKESWGPGPKHGANTANVKRYIDFAARHGFAACWWKAGTRAGTTIGSPTARISASPKLIPISTSRSSPATAAPRACG
jgi:alpha-glucosidase